MKMKKYVIANNVFITVQILLLALGIALNFIADDTKVFVAVFAHIGLFVLYNAVVENIVEYGFLRKKYAKICDETHYLRYFKLKKRMYNTAKNINDTVTTTLILQSFLKSLIALVSVVMLLLTVTFQ